MQVSRHFCTLTNPSDDPSARPGPDPSRATSCSRRSDRPEFASRAPAVHRRLHCGNGTDADLHGGRPVLPPFTSGLHCGTNCITSTTSSSGCSRRSPAGSIAAGSRNRGPSAASTRSRRSRRAPLRLRGRGERQRPHRRLLPLFTGGLHYGNFLIQGGAADLMVLPPVNGGSIAASRSTSSGTPCPTAPAVHRRAPLRPSHPGAHISPYVSCSRCSAAGSIAACNTHRNPRGSSACSRRSPAGSIAARSPALVRRSP